MRRISLSDNTLRFSDERAGEKLSFRLKVEVAKTLDKLGVGAIELSPLRDGKSDYFLVKSVAAAVKNAVVAVPVDVFNPEEADLVWDALKEAANPRLQVILPVSTVQMEYFCHKKPEGILKLVSEGVSRCSAICPDVEFVACDFTRSDEGFLKAAVEAAVDAGAGMITLSDAAGDLLPDEFQSFVSKVKAYMAGSNVRLGVSCSNELGLADTCAVAAVREGVDEVKVSVFGRKVSSLLKFSRILEARSESIDVTTGIDMTRIRLATERIRRMCDAGRSKSPAATGVSESEKYDDLHLTIGDTKDTVLAAAAKLGYELFEEDADKVYEAFVKVCATNDSIEAKELDAIVASVAFQVPPTYILDSFVINSGNIITATCHIRLKKGNEILESACLGDGPVDAAFMAIEKVVGRHYELDDFQIKSVTEGREAMGDAVVRLRYEGKIYSGRGVSTDIIGSSIMAYLSAVNKIAYEEVQA